LGAKKITLVMDNLNTHAPASLYERFRPAVAKVLWDRFEFLSTPKHGSWLNMAEIEWNVLIGQRLDRRIGNISKMREDVAPGRTQETMPTPESTGSSRPAARASS
jgi:hypothetical protein